MVSVMSEAVVTGLDVDVLLEVLEAGDAAARVALARQLGSHLADPDTPEIEREQVSPVLLKLAADPERDVRLALNEELVTVSTLSADVVFALISDDDDLALPFLSVTPALTKAHMLAILRVGDPARQVTVAGREDLSAEAAHYIMRNSPPRIVAELLRNPAARFEIADYRSIYERHANVPALVEILLEHRNIPTDIRITEAKRTASRMRQMMAENGWIAANDAQEAIADAEELTILKIIMDAPQDRLASTMRFLSDKNMLTPSLMVRATALGEIAVVEAILAHLSGYSLERTREFMFRRGSQGVKSLFSKCGLPVNCLGIVMAGCDVKHDASNEDYDLSREVYGRRVLEALMTRYEFLTAADRSRQIEYLGRYADEKVRKIARRLRTDLSRAA
jgi:uncharacterized protein (DUF2336 family)